MSDKRAADDFSAINRRLSEIQCERVASAVDEQPATAPVAFCRRCESGGWIQVYSPRPPAFEICPDCFNPQGIECP